jgi:hypothetical protein
MEYNNDFKYDLKLGQVKEAEVGEIFNYKTIEVKYDLQAPYTKNVYVEYKCNGKPSGIITSVADYYCFCIDNTYHFILTSDLKHKCKKYLGTNRDIIGGDSNTTKGIILPITELF